MVTVYYSALPDAQIGEPLGCESRNSMISGISNETVRREKYYAWRLLEHAILDTFGRSAREVTFELDGKGVFFCEDFFFSLSHSKNALAVAVSDTPCGVDVEYLHRTPHARKIAERVFSPELRAALSECSDDEIWLAEFFRAWTLFEAEYKRNYTARGQGSPDLSVTEVLTLGTDTYYLSAVGEGEYLLKFTDLHTGGKNAGDN